MSPKKSKNGFKVSINIGSVTKGIIVCGILCLILESIPLGEWDEKAFVAVIKDLLQSLGTTLNTYAK